MKGFIRKGAVIVAGMLLTGCGDDLKTLTESEEEIIVNYSSGTVGKFNKRKMDGMTAVSPDEEIETEEPENSKEEPVKEETEKPETPEKPEDSNETPKPEDEQEEPKVNLTQAVGIAGVEFKYTGYEIKDSYEESDYFSMAAKEGNTYIVAKYTITNTGSEEIACDILSKMPIFTLHLNGASDYKNEVTLLSNDLSTYIANLAPGASAEAVLIFEVPVKETTAITSVEIDVQIGETNGDAVI